MRPLACEVATCVLRQRVVPLHGWSAAQISSHRIPSSSVFARTRIAFAGSSPVGSVSGVPRGTLRVTAPSWFAARRMVDMIAAYRQRYPEVVVDISFEDRFVELIEEGYDLALRVTGDEPPAVGPSKIYDQEPSRQRARRSRDASPLGS